MASNKVLVCLKTQEEGVCWGYGRKSRVGGGERHTCPISLHLNRCTYPNIKSVLHYLPWSNIDMSGDAPNRTRVSEFGTIDIYGWTVIC